MKTKDAQTKSSIRSHGPLRCGRKRNCILGHGDRSTPAANPSQQWIVVTAGCQVIGPCALIFFSPASRAAIFDAKRLTAPGAHISVFATGLSPTGLSSGFSRRADTTYDPFLWSPNGEPVALAVPFPEFSGDAYDFAGTSILAAGQVRPNDEGFGIPVVWRDEQLIQLPYPDQGGGAFGGGANGEIITGSVNIGGAGAKQVAAVWIGKQLHQLSSLPGINNTARTANKFGTYVGVWSVLSDQGRFIYGAFRGANGSAEVLNFPELDHEELRTYDINDSGALVGFFYRTGAPFIAHGYYKPGDGPAIELGLLPGRTQNPIAALNNAGSIVGMNLDADFNETAVVYFNGSPMPIDMNTLIDPIPGVKLVRGVDINDAGQILVEGAGVGGTTYYVLSPVPEPGIFAGVACGAALLQLRRRK